MTKQDEWQTRAARWICVALGILGAYLLLRYVALSLLPFLIAWGVALIVYPLSVRTARRLHLPQKLMAVVYVILLLGLLAAGLWLGVARLFSEIESLLGRLSEEDNEIVTAVDGLWGQITSFFGRFPFFGGAGESGVGTAVSDLLRQTVSALGAQVGGLFGLLLGAAPSVLFGVVVSLVACFCLAVDYERIRDALLGLLPHRARARAEGVRRRAVRVLTAYGRAYLILFALTFAQVLIGLCLLQIPYAFLVALAVAAVDILPALGSGTVLLPWALFLFLGGNGGTALGILILYGVISIVRQIAEPHLLGGSLGVHPLLSLFCMFLGWQLFGLLGMLLGPAVALCLQECFREWEPKESSCKMPRDGV